MKTLYLLRHAHSGWGDSSRSDFDRTLSVRGESEVAGVGELMRERGVAPTLVLCSPALRTRRTSERVLEGAGTEAELRLEARIYDATPELLLEVLSEIADDVAEVLLVGHNPGMEGLLAHLTGESEHIGTATLARIILPSEGWAEVREARGRLDWLARQQGAATD